MYPRARDRSEAALGVVGTVSQILLCLKQSGGGKGSTSYKPVWDTCIDIFQKDFKLLWAFLRIVKVVNKVGRRTLLMVSTVTGKLMLYIYIYILRNYTAVRVELDTECACSGARLSDAGLSW